MKTLQVITLLSGLAIGSYTLQAQESINTAGTSVSGTGGSVSYSLGQVSYTSQTSSNGSITAGVQQSYSIITSIGNDIERIQLELSAYPNPVKDYLTLKAEAYSSEQTNYFLYDNQGKLLKEKQITSAKTTISMNHLPAAIYFLKITERNQLIKSFTIIKN